MINYDDIEVTCPYCGEVNVMNIEIGINSADEFITDCEICCRSFIVNVITNSEGIINIDIKNDDGF